MRSSSSQYCRKSLPLTSALLPSETKLEMPMPACVAALSTAIPTAPDCEASAMGPGMAVAAPNDASRRIDGSVLTNPTQLGPMILMPCLRAAFVSCALALRSVGADLGESSTDDDQPSGAFGRAVARRARPPCPPRWRRCRDRSHPERRRPIGSRSDLRRCRLSRSPDRSRHGILPRAGCGRSRDRRCPSGCWRRSTATEPGRIRCSTDRASDTCSRTGDPVDQARRTRRGASRGARHRAPMCALALGRSR